MTRILVLTLLISLTALEACKNEDAIAGDLLFEQGKYEKAVEAYNKYLELQPTHLKSIYNRGRAYEELNQYDKALKDFEQVLGLDAKNVNAYLSIGNYHYRQERFDIAAYNFEKAVENNASHAESRYLWGKSLHKLGKFSQALEQYNFAISLNKDYGEAYLNRGILYVAMKNRRKACTDLKTAKALEVNDANSALSKYCR